MILSMPLHGSWWEYARVSPPHDGNTMIDCETGSSIWRQDRRSGRS